MYNRTLLFTKKIIPHPFQFVRIKLERGMSMIEVILDHSTEEDYFMISSVSVNINDEQEKARVEKLVVKNNLEGLLVDGDRGLALRIADAIGVNVQLINIDTQEIDLM